LSIRISPVITARTHACQWTDWVRSVEVPTLGEGAAPISRLDHFRLTGPAVGPRLDLGFAAITYVLRDSDASLRSRDSLGNDVLMRPGGLLWMRAGCGVAHEHLPAEIGKQVSCLQLCVKVGHRFAHALPAVVRLEPEQVPEWWGRSGDCVHVAAGAYAGHAPPVLYAPSFTLLDVRLRSAVYFDLLANHTALVYVVSGFALAMLDGQTRRLESGQAFAAHNQRGNALLQVLGSAHLLILDAAAQPGKTEHCDDHCCADAAVA
jgi:redox-sensitive bicupin YhaK (pirin superfamily)